jgi:hypothetical protein
MKEQEPQQLGPERPQPDQVPAYVHLPSLVQDEFGISALEAKNMIALGSVEIDGELVKPESFKNRFSMRYEDIVDKEILIKGETKSVKIHYKG